jgi:hypothetical protein
MGVGAGAGSFILNGQGTSLTLASGAPLTLDGVSEASLTVMNGAVINGGTTSALQIGVFGAAGVPGLGGNSQVSVTSGGTVTAGRALVVGNPTAGFTSTLTISNANSKTTLSNDLSVLNGGAVDVSKHSDISNCAYIVMVRSSRYEASHHQ